MAEIPISMQVKRSFRQYLELSHMHWMDTKTLTLFCTMQTLRDPVEEVI